MQKIQPDFRSELHERGFRATPERMRLLHVLWSAQRPLTVDEIGKKLDCNVVTLYRALNDLRVQGLVVRGIGAAGRKAINAGISVPRIFRMPRRTITTT